jgi:hypothetical protein
MKRSNRRLKTKIRVFRDNNFRPKKISSIIITIIVSIVLVLLISYLSINFSYQSKINYKTENIGEETTNAVVILNSSEVEDAESVGIIHTIEELYLNRKITKINIYLLNSIAGSEEIKNAINSKITKFDTSVISYNFLYNDVKDVCLNVQNDGASKGIIFTNGDKIIRSLYLCNFFNLYYTGFKEQGGEEISSVKFVNFPQFLSDFIEILFKPTSNER